MRHDVNSEQGFTFIEVLIAMLVLGVSVLAFAGLQVRALETTGISHMRSQAVTLAADLVERMRANDVEMSIYRSAMQYNGAAIPAGSPDEWVAPGVGCMRFSDVLTPGCSTAQLAAFDINEIEYLAGQLLPEGRVRVAACTDVADMECVVVAWGGVDPADCETNATPNCIVMQTVVQ